MKISTTFVSPQSAARRTMPAGTFLDGPSAAGRRAAGFAGDVCPAPGQGFAFGQSTVHDVDIPGLRAWSPPV